MIASVDLSGIAVLSNLLASWLASEWHVRLSDLSSLWHIMMSKKLYLFKNWLSKEELQSLYGYFPKDGNDYGRYGYL